MGLVLIPVGLYKTTVDNDIHFNQLCKDSKERIQYKKYCRHCNKEVTSDDIIKGYEYEKGKYVVMTNEELGKIKKKKDKSIHIIQFARMSEVNMIYYEKDYYAVPDTGAEKVYELLRQALLSQRKVVKSVPKMKLDENELNTAKMLIENMIKSLEPAAFQDEYQARLRGRFTRRYRDRKLSQWIPAARPM